MSKILENSQVCNICGSCRVARCKWVNVNTDIIYHSADSGTFSEWCMECDLPTNIITALEYMQDQLDAHTDIDYEKEESEFD